MRMSLASSILLLTIGPALAEEADQSWTLVFEWQPVVGMKIHETNEEKYVTHMKISSGEKILYETNSEKTASFDFTSEVTAVEGDSRTGVKWRFKTARFVEDGEETRLGFEGKGVVGTRGKDEEWTYAYEDGTPVAADDLEALADACGTVTKEEGTPSDSDMFDPKKPVKAGESWSPDLKAVVASFGEGAEVDMKASKGVCTLQSVETKGGARFGTILLDFNLGMIFPDPIRLESSIPLILKGEARMCIDGTRPDVNLKLDAKVKGTRKGTIAQEGESVAIELETDMKVNLAQSKQTIK